MNQQWQNRRLDELIAEMGTPRRVLTVPGTPMPPTFAIMYGRHEGTGCIDAFAISPGQRDEPVVRVYHCR